jgi:hypothetical protein
MSLVCGQDLREYFRKLLFSLTISSLRNFRPDIFSILPYF